MDKKLLRSRSPAASSLLLLSSALFKKKSCQGWERRAEMLGYGVKREAGAAAEAPRTRPEAERNSQECAAHYMFTHGKRN